MTRYHTMLDLDRVDLYGWEPVKSIQTVEAVIRGIENGDTFPPVYVYDLGESRYRLFTLDGGHNRSVGHYIAGEPLRCIVKGPGDKYWLDGTCIRIDSLRLHDKPRIPIGEIQLIDDITDYLDRKRECLNWR